MNLINRLQLVQLGLDVFELVDDEAEAVPEAIVNVGAAAHLVTIAQLERTSRGSGEGLEGSKAQW